MFSNTIRNTNQHVFIWKIVQFSACCNGQGESLRSPKFTAECIDNTNWYIDFYPRGESGDDNFASIYLWRCRWDGGDPYCVCAFSMEIIGMDGTIFFSKQAEALILHHRHVGWPDFIPIEKLKHYKIIFPDDILFIRCRIKYGVSWTKPRNSWNFAETIIGSERIAFHVEMESLSPCSAELGDSYKTIKFECPPTEIFIMYVFFFESEIHLYITKHEEVDNVKIVCELSLIDINGSKGKSVKEDYLFGIDDNGDSMLTLKLKENQLLKRNNRYQNDNVINLLFDISVSNGLESIGFIGIINQPLEKSDVNSGTEIESELQDDLLKLYVSTLFTDIILRTEKGEYHAHKAILSVRSPVLCDILEDERVDVLYFLDTEDKILNYFLKFLYGGILTDITFETAYKLHDLAERYKVASLGNWLNAWLGEMISVGNLHTHLVKSALES